MNTKAILAGVLGGVVVFFWGFVSHTLLPLGEVGIQELPNEAAIVPAMQASIPSAGFYMFPGMGVPHREADEATRKAWEEKYAAGPTGVLIYHPEGGEAMSPRQLGTELGSNILAALVAAFLLAQVAPGRCTYVGRAFFVAALGLFSGLDVLVSYWNWYGFPGDFIAAGMTDSFVAWLLAGLLMAAMIKPGHPA